MASTTQTVFVCVAENRTVKIAQVCRKRELLSMNMTDKLELEKEALEEMKLIDFDLAKMIITNEILEKKAGLGEGPGGPRA